MLKRWAIEHTPTIIAEDKLQLARDSDADEAYNSTALADADFRRLSATIVASGAAMAYNHAFNVTQNHGRVRVWPMG